MPRRAPQVRQPFLVACVHVHVPSSWTALLDEGGPGRNMLVLCVSGHVIALDVKRLQLFCCACQDYVYDADFDRAKLVRAP